MSTTPNVIGKPISEARTLIIGAALTPREKGINPGRAKEKDGGIVFDDAAVEHRPKASGAAPETVISQDPTPGTERAEFSFVDLHVSAALPVPEVVPTPSV